MGYLLAAEYAEFGLSVETADAWVTAASAMMEAYCKRPTLLAQSYTERMRVSRSQCVRVSYGPLVSVDAVQAKYRRHAEGCSLLAFQQELIEGFGAAQAWVPVDVSTLDVDASTGEIRFAANGGLLGLPYAEVQVSYTAGLAAVPNALKVACAQIVKNAQATPGMNVKSSRMDTLQMEYFSDSLLDQQVRALLQSYVAERLG
ncbi:MAG: hypothetical protein ABI142_11290 [Bryocella sp.]